MQILAVFDISAIFVDMEKNILKHVFGIFGIADNGADNEIKKLPVSGINFVESIFLASQKAACCGLRDVQGLFSLLSLSIDEGKKKKVNLLSESKMENPRKKCRRVALLTPENRLMTTNKAKTDPSSLPKTKANRL